MPFMMLVGVIAVVVIAETCIVAVAVGDYVCVTVCVDIVVSVHADGCGIVVDCGCVVDVAVVVVVCVFNVGIVRDDVAWCIVCVVALVFWRCALCFRCCCHCL